MLRKWEETGREARVCFIFSSMSSNTIVCWENEKRLVERREFVSYFPPWVLRPLYVGKMRGNWERGESSFHIFLQEFQDHCMLGKWEETGREVRVCFIFSSMSSKTIVCWENALSFDLTKILTPLKTQVSTNESNESQSWNWINQNGSKDNCPVTHAICPSQIKCCFLSYLIKIAKQSFRTKHGWSVYFYVIRRPFANFLATQFPSNTSLFLPC